MMFDLRFLRALTLSLAIFAQSAHAQTLPLPDTDPGPGRGTFANWIDNVLNPILGTFVQKTVTPAGGDLCGLYPNPTVCKAGIDSNALGNGGAPVTGNYAVQIGDCGKTILAGTGSSGQFTLTLPSTSGFPATCSLAIKNGDTTNGKILSGFPSDLPSILYPRQSLGTKIVNGAWQSFFSPGPWQPLGGANLYASASGSDSNDCLTVGTACTLPGVCLMRSNIFGTSTATINIANGSYTASDGNGARCTIFGNGGGTSPVLTTLLGNCGTPGGVILLIPTGLTGILVKDGGEVVPTCMDIDGAAASTGTIGIFGGQFAVVDVNNVRWGGTWGSGSRHMQFSQSASLNLDPGGETILSNFDTHWRVSVGSNLSAAGTTTCAITPTFTTLLSVTAAVANLSSWSSSGCGGSIGTRAILSGNGFAFFGGTPCNTLLFGNSNCQITSGFQDDAGDALTTPLPGADTALATSSAPGTVPAWPNNITTYYRGDGTYATLNFAAISGNATVAQGGTGATAPGATAANNIGALAQSSNLSDLVNAGAARGNLGVAIGSNVEAWAANLDTYAGKAPPSGTVVGTTDTQALTNKTIDTANNTWKLNGTAVATAPDMRTQTEQGRTLVSVNAIGSGANYQDTTSITSACDDYDIVLDDLIPATNGVGVELLVHSNGAFQNTGYLNASGGITTYGDVIGAAITTLGNTDGMSGTISLFAVNSGVHKKIRGALLFITNAGAAAFGNGGWTWNGGPTAIDGFELLPTGGGNWTGGKVKVYCLRPAM